MNQVLPISNNRSAACPIKVAWERSLNTSSGPLSPTTIERSALTSVLPLLPLDDNNVEHTMKTRRKSKVEHEHEAVSQATEENAPNTISDLEIPSDIDIESLQSILPDVSLTSPSPDSILSLYRLLLAQVENADAIQREIEEARAEAERKDVELDQALQDRESLTNDLEKSLDSLQNELKEVKQERDQFGK